MNNLHKKYIYIMVSQTPTRFGKLIRKAAKMDYNHVSIAFDENLYELYSFGRYQNKVPIIAGLVKEYPERFSLRKEKYVKVKIFKVPVEHKSYLLAQDKIYNIINNHNEYLYNLFSVLTFPLLKGFETYKAYTCCEFVVLLLREMNLGKYIYKKSCKVTPKDFEFMFEDYLHYEGNLLDYCNNPYKSRFFFEKPKYIYSNWLSFIIILKLIYRSTLYKICTLGIRG